MLRGCHSVSHGNGSGMRCIIRVSLGTLDESSRTRKGCGEFICVLVCLSHGLDTAGMGKSNRAGKDVWRVHVCFCCFSPWLRQGDAYKVSWRELWKWDWSRCTAYACRSGVFARAVRQGTYMSGQRVDLVASSSVWCSRVTYSEPWEWDWFAATYMRFIWASR